MDYQAHPSYQRIGSWVSVAAGIAILAIASPSSAAEPPAISENETGVSQEKIALVDRLMAALPLEVEQISILQEAQVLRTYLASQYPDRATDIEAAHQKLEYCVRNGMSVDVRAAMRDSALDQLELEELESIASFYESDAFRNLQQISGATTPTAEEKKQLIAIVMRPEMRKFTRLLVSTGIKLAQSGKEPSPDRDCKSEHNATLLAAGLTAAKYQQ